MTFFISLKSLPLYLGCRLSQAGTQILQSITCCRYPLKTLWESQYGNYHSSIEEYQFIIFSLMQEEPFISLDSAFPGTMENKSSLEAATGLLLNTVSECLEHNRFFFFRQEQTTFFFPFLFWSTFYYPIWTTGLYHNRKKNFLRMLVCGGREKKKKTVRSIGISPDKTGILWPVCTDLLYCILQG